MLNRFREPILKMVSGSSSSQSFQTSQANCSPRQNNSPLSCTSTINLVCKQTNQKNLIKSFQKLLLFCQRKNCKKAEKQTGSGAGALSLIPRLNPLYSAVPYFSNSIIHPLGQDQQNVKQAQCQLISQSFRINFKDTPSQSLSNLFISRIFVELCFKPIYPTNVGEHFQICSVQITGKCIL